jgi:hypothetical protein
MYWIVYALYIQIRSTNAIKKPSHTCITVYKVDTHIIVGFITAGFKTGMEK